MLESLLAFIFSTQVHAAPLPSAATIRVVQGEDVDRDGFGEDEDLCLEIPGPEDGCPKIPTYQQPTEVGTTVQIGAGAEGRIDFVEQDAVRSGDSFTATVWDPVSHEVFSESNVIIVE